MPSSHTLPDDPVYAFCPSYDLDNVPQQIRIVFDNMPGYVPTALFALTLDDALRICNRLNARLGLDYHAWSAIAGQAMSAATMKPPIEPYRPVYSRQRALRHVRATGRWGKPCRVMLPPACCGS